MSWTTGGEEKPVMSWHELRRQHARGVLTRQWGDIVREHARDGCCLDDDVPWPKPVVCVIHGYFKGDRVLTLKDWLGDG